MQRLASLLGPLALFGVFALSACDKQADPPAEPVAVEGAQLQAQADEAPAADEPTQAGEAVAAAGVGADGAECACKKAGDCPGDGACPCEGGDCCDDMAGCPCKGGEGACGGGDAATAAAGSCGGAAKAACGGAKADKAAGGCCGAALAAAVPSEPVVADAPADLHEGCGGHAAMAAAPATDEAAAGDDARHFGAEFALTGPKPLAELLGASPEGSEEVVQISGTIHEVCQTKGCWMVVRDGEHEARVVMKGYSFFVPKDSKGKATLIEGTVQVKTITEDHAKHLAEDAGKDPAAVTGDRKEYVVTASGITIRG